jgi:uncharacterized protein YjbJ (UPF0337 family)
MIEIPIELPWWPPEPDEPIGEERAAELVQRLREIAGPVVDRRTSGDRQQRHGLCISNGCRPMWRQRETPKERVAAMTDADRDRIEGAFDQAKGSVKEGVGNATDNEDQQAEGKVDQVKGKGKDTMGDAKDAVGDAVDKFKKDK